MDYCFTAVPGICLFMDGHRLATVVLCSLLKRSHLASRVVEEAAMGIICSARTLAIVCFIDLSILNRVCYSHLFSSCFTEFRKRGSVAGSPKVQCMVVTISLDFTS